VLSFADLLRIETVFQHVVRNTVEFSKDMVKNNFPDYLSRSILTTE
jgi:hypothetical protein